LKPAVFRPISIVAKNLFENLLKNFVFLLYSCEDFAYFRGGNLVAIIQDAEAFIIFATADAIKFTSEQKSP